MGRSSPGGTVGTIRRKLRKSGWGMITRACASWPSLDSSRVHMALSKLSSASSLPDLPPKPVHPPSKFVFPKREFGKKQVVKRSCQVSWFSTWPWLHYQANDPDDVVFCYVCVSALKSKKMD
jgi:hypothetical protein